jgi:hypothetical protein
MTQSTDRGLSCSRTEPRAATKRGPLKARAQRLGAGVVLVSGITWLSLASCGGSDDAFDNPSFDRWCMDRPCDWDLDTGHVSSVATWHNKDRAVRFEPGSDAQISQRVSGSWARCLRFDVIAFVEDDASLVMRLDFDDDQVFEREQVVSEAAWESVPFTVPTPIVYDSLRFILLKRGKGSAELAQIVMSAPENCAETSSARDTSSACGAGVACGPGAEAGSQTAESE